MKNLTKTTLVILASLLIVLGTSCKKNPEKNDVTKPNTEQTQNNNETPTDENKTGDENKSGNENKDEQSAQEVKGALVTVNVKTMNGDVTPKDETMPIFIKHLAKTDIVANEKGKVEVANKAQATMNTAYKRHETEADDLLKDMYEIMGNGEIDTARLTAQPWTLTTEIAEVRNDEKVLSLTEELYYDAGGAHPSKMQFAYNFDMTTGNSVSYDDITGADEESKKAFEDKVTEKLKAKYGDEAFVEDYSIEGGSYAEASKDAWYFTENGVVVVFNEYKIAPYAAGRFEIEFAKDELPETAQKYFA